MAQHMDHFQEVRVDQDSVALVVHLARAELRLAQEDRPYICMAHTP